MAELALYVIELNRNHLKVDLEALTARAWAWLGNARRLVYDYPGAEAAFRRAELLLKKPSTQGKPRYRGELYFFQAALKEFQGHLREARQLAVQAVEAFEEAGDAAGTSRALIQQGNILCLADAMEDALENHLRAFELAKVPGSGNEDIQLVCAVNLAADYASLGEVSRARAYLDMALDLVRPWSIPTVRFQLTWIAGAIEMIEGRFEVAERALLSAKEGLAALEELDYVALVSLDLSILYHQAGRMVDLFKIARETLAIAQALGTRPKVAAAKKLLSRALAEEALTLEGLAAIRDELRVAVAAPRLFLPKRKAKDRRDL